LGSDIIVHVPCQDIGAAVVIIIVVVERRRVRRRGHVIVAHHVRQGGLRDCAGFTTRAGGDDDLRFPTCGGTHRHHGTALLSLQPPILSIIIRAKKKIKLYFLNFWLSRKKGRKYYMETGFYFNVGFKLKLLTFRFKQKERVLCCVQKKLCIP